MTTDDIVQFALTHWPHAINLAAGFLAKPAYQKAHKITVLLARAIVSHEDGDDKDALQDVVQAATVLRSTPPPPPPPPPGTVKEWPKS